MTTAGGGENPARMEAEMGETKVRDIMVPLDEYPVVDENATLLDVVEALDAGKKRLPPGKHPYRAVLVVGSQGKIVGKIGQFAFLAALEPKYNLLGDLDRLQNSGLSPEFVSTVMDHYRFFEESLPDLCQRCSTLKVTDAMHPLSESVDESASIADAIHKIVMWQHQSLLVTRGDEVVGLIRLPDLYDEIAQQMKSLAK
jgi:predicted transcriptional regulator